MSVINAMASAIYTKLKAGTALTALLPGSTSIYHMQAPDNPTFPYVVYSLQAGGPLNQTPSDMRDEIFFIRGYSKVSALSAGSIDTQISSLLHHGSISVTGYTNFVINREQDFANIENTPADDKIFMAGAFYRFRLDT